MGVSLAGADEEEGEQETAAERWGLTWDPEEGPVWGNIGHSVGEEQEDIWTQLLRGGVTGITTDRDGEDTSYFWNDVMSDLTVPIRSKHFPQMEKMKKIT